MEKFEYKIIHCGFWWQDEEKLNKLGTEGWELIVISENSMYLKRKIESKN